MNWKNLFGLAWASACSHFALLFHIIYLKTASLYKVIFSSVSLVNKSWSPGKEQKREEASPFRSHYEPQNFHTELCHMGRVAKMQLLWETWWWIVKIHENRQAQSDKKMIEKYFPNTVYGNLISDPPNKEQK